MRRSRDALRAPGLGAIAEIKRRSPSAGDLRAGADPAALAAAFERAGAAAVSVLVDERFGGSLDDLRARARPRRTRRCSRKGFFTRGAAAAAAQAAGADAALLLLRDLDDARARADRRTRASSASTRSSRRTTPAELERAIALARRSIGINARDLVDLRDRPARAARARRAAPRDRVVVAESGIESRAQGAAAELAGADACSSARR